MVTCEESTGPVAAFDAVGLAEAFASLPVRSGLPMRSQPAPPDALSDVQRRHVCRPQRTAGR